MRRIPIAVYAAFFCFAGAIVAPRASADGPTILGPTDGPFDITIDTSQVPNLKDWADKELHPTLEKWYAIIINDLPTEGFTPPTAFTVTLEANGKGVAVTTGTRVTANAKWITDQLTRGPKSEALGALVHEAVHVAQLYGKASGPNKTTVWLREGIADYIRWWKYETAATRRPFKLNKPDGTPVSYQDGYHTTAQFLEYLATTYDHEIVVKLNSAGRKGTYMPGLFMDYTGKSLDDLWFEFMGVMSKKVGSSSRATAP